ncbi:MAG: M16 family metallopeptidase [Vicinamibacterales bacterium]
MRLPKWGLAVILALAVASPVLEAQSAAPAAGEALAPSRPLPTDEAVRTGTLANGLRYFIRKNDRPANRVSLRLAVDAGSIQEQDNQRGLAHFLEHMAFNGTENFAPGELVSFLESIGARFGPHVNAYTSFDETVYMLDVPSDREGYVDRGLLALHDFAAGMKLEPEEIEKERGVVIEEWRGRLGANSRLTDKQLPVLFKGSRYADRLPIGEPEILRTFPRERLADFYRTWYRPDRMAVVVVGAVDPAEAEALVQKRFGGIVKPSSPPPQVDRSVPPNPEALYSVATDPEAQGWTVSVAYKRPVEVESTVGDYRRSLVQSLVVRMLNLRLQEISRRPDAPFLGASAGGGSLGRTLNLFQVGAAVPEGQIRPGLDAVVRESRRMTQFGFSADELERARASVLAGYERAYKERDTTESPSYAGEYVRAFLEQEAIPGIEFEYRIASELLPTVTTDEALGEARRLVHDDNRIVLAVAPEKAGQAVPTEAELKETFTTASAAEVTPWTDAVAGRALVADPPAPGRVTGRRELPEVGTTVLTLSNGVEVWLKPTDFKNDQVLFSAQALGGISLAGEQDFREASLATSLVGMGGLGDFSPVDLNKLLAGKIATASPSIGAYTQGVSGQATPKDLETALQLTYLTFTAPNMSDQAFDLLKRRFSAMLENQEENPRFVFGERVEQVNTSHHYTADAPTAADVPKLRLDVMRDFYRARFANAADFRFFLVGAFDIAQVTPLLERWIGGLPSTGRAISAFKDMGLAFPEGIVKEEVHKGREPASQTVMSFFADTNLDELEMHRARAAASLVGIRLRDILREELGGTYSVGVSYQNALPQNHYGSMTVQFGSAPENVGKLTAAVLAEVERLRTEGPSADDVARVQELERRDLETSQRQNAYWIGSLQTVALLGWDPAGIAHRDERIEKLTPEILHTTIQKYFPLDRYTVVTLLPEQK